MVRLAGIEPTTPWFVAKYSIQLSYSRTEEGNRRTASFVLVGAAGFELATLCSQSRCATRLRYAPTSCDVYTVFEKNLELWLSCTFIRSLLLCKTLRELFSRNGAAIPIPLSKVTACIQHDLVLFQSFHAFGHHLHAQLMGHHDDRLAQENIFRITVQIAHKAAINLDVINIKTLQVSNHLKL